MMDGFVEVFSCQKMKFIFTVIVFLSCYFAINAQDSVLIKKIDSLSQYAYDHRDTTLFFLTESDFLRTGSGTELMVFSYKKKIQRMVCISRHQQGVSAAEYYLHNDSLVFVFESSSYYREKAPQWSVKDFRQVHSSEHRFYFWNGKRIHSFGLGAAPSFSEEKHSRELLEDCSRIISWYRKITGK